MIDCDRKDELVKVSFKNFHYFVESKALELDVSVNGLAASCLVLGNQEDKVTMNILIKSLMDSLKGEADVTLQVS